MLRLCEAQARRAAADTPWHFTGMCALVDPSASLKLSGPELAAVTAAWSTSPSDTVAVSRADATSRALGNSAGHAEADARAGFGSSAPLSDAQEWFNKKLRRARCLHLCCEALDHPQPALALRAERALVSGARAAAAKAADRNGHRPTAPPELVSMTSDRVLRELHLPHCGLALLSRSGALDATTHRSQLDAPPTGRASVTDALLQAGALSVVRPFWSKGVPPVCAIFLVLKFHDELVARAGADRPVASALRAAQLWLRAASCLKLRALYTGRDGLTPGEVGSLDAALRGFVRPATAEDNDWLDAVPFYSPLYWAPWSASGACTGVHDRSVDGVRREADGGDDADDSDDQDEAADIGGEEFAAWWAEFSKDGVPEGFDGNVERAFFNYRAGKGMDSVKRKGLQMYSGFEKRGMELFSEAKRRISGYVGGDAKAGGASQAQAQSPAAGRYSVSVARAESKGGGDSSSDDEDDYGDGAGAGGSKACAVM